MFLAISTSFNDFPTRFCIIFSVFNGLPIQIVASFVCANGFLMEKWRERNT